MYIFQKKGVCLHRRSFRGVTPPPLDRWFFYVQKEHGGAI